MEDEADEFVEVAVATGTGLNWDIPGKEGVLVSLSPGKGEKTQCGELVLSGK